MSYLILTISLSQEVTLKMHSYAAAIDVHYAKLICINLYLCIDSGMHVCEWHTFRLLCRWNLGKKSNHRASPQIAMSTFPEATHIVYTNHTIESSSSPLHGGLSTLLANLKSLSCIPNQLELDIPLKTTSVTHLKPIHSGISRQANQQYDIRSACCLLLFELNIPHCHVP